MHDFLYFFQEVSCRVPLTQHQTLNCIFVVGRKKRAFAK